MNRFYSAFMVLLCVGLLLSSGNAVMGGLAYTEMAQIEITSTSNPQPDPGGLGANPPIDDIIQLAFGGNGRVYTNTYANQGGTSIASDIRSVGILTLDNLSQSGNPDFNGLRYDDPNTAEVENDRVVALFGVQGFETIGPLNNTPAPVNTDNGRFAEGAFRFYAVPGGGNIDTDDPATWNPDDLSFITSYRLKEHVLGPNAGDPVAGVGPNGPRDSLLPGVNGQNVAVPFPEMDVSGVNTAIGSVGDGDFMFLEFDDETGALGTDPFIDLFYTTYGTDGTDGVDVGPAGNGDPFYQSIPDHEALHAFTRQTIQPFFDAANAAQQATLDSIALSAFGDVFAAFGAGDDTDWIPLGGDSDNPDSDEGDFKAQLTADAEPVSQVAGVIPEPASVVAWALLGGIALVTWRLRGRR